MIRTLALVALAALAAAPQIALAQIDAPTLIDEVDPPADPNDGDDEPAATPARRRAGAATAPAAEPPAPSRTSDPSLEDAEQTRSRAEPILERRRPTPPPAATAPVQPAVAKEPAKPEAAARPPARPIIVPAAGDAELLAVYASWRKASAELDVPGAAQARAELLQLKEELAISNLEPFAVGFIRASEAKARANDSLGAIELAQTAVELAPGLPYTHVALAHAYLNADSTALGRYFGEMQAALGLIWSDPYYARPAAADLGASLLLALLVAVTAVTLVLIARRLGYFLHDFHHLFPKAAARWQSAVFAIILLSLPVVFRVGLAPTLLVLFAAVTFYLSTSERLVAAISIALLGVIPLGAAKLVDASAFVGTAAEDVYQLERGGLAAADAARRVTARAELERASFQELYALGRYRLRRGELDAAIERLKKAAVKRSNDPRLLTNLANAMLARGDQEGAADLYVNAAQADSSLAAPYYNLSKLHYRRVSTLPDEQVPSEIDKAGKALETAKQLDASLALREARPARLTDEQWESEKLKLARMLISPPLRPDEIASLATAGERPAKVQAQVAARLVGHVSPTLGALYPLLAALGLVGLGFLRSKGSASLPCEKCGRPVCRRCDPELSIGSSLCNQCVNAFARKNAVGPAVRARKQIEIERYHRRNDRLSWALGMIFSGAGHVFSGVPIRGALYAVLFAFLIATAVMKNGVLRVPYGQMPEYLVLVPTGIAFVLLYALSLRGLYKRQAEDT